MQEAIAPIKAQIDRMHLGLEITPTWQFYVVRNYILDLKGQDVGESLNIRSQHEMVLLHNACHYALDYFARKFELVKVTNKDRADQIHVMFYGKDRPFGKRDAESPI